MWAAWHARDAAERRCVAGQHRSRQSLKGANVERRRCRERAQCSTERQHKASVALLEVECRIGVACEKGAGLGSATAAAKRFVAGRRGCGAVSIGGSSVFCPGGL